MVDSVLLALQRATHATLEGLAQELGDLGLPPSEMNVLVNLADRRPRTVSRLAADVGSRPTTMTAVLDRLESRGWIARRSHPEDRRALLVELTEDGRPYADRARRAYRRVERRALAGLAGVDAASLRRSLDTIAEHAHD